MIVHGDSSGPKLPATTNTASGGTLTTGAITSTNAFANQVDFLNPMSINWQYSVDNGTNWCDAGTSANQVYVTWTNSLNTIHTLLDVGCRKGVSPGYWQMSGAFGASHLPMAGTDPNGA